MSKLGRGGTERTLLGVISSHEGELSLRLFSERRRLVAVVIGSEAYLHRALVAVGLASAIAPLAKDRGRPRVTLIRRKPANGHP